MEGNSSLGVASFLNNQNESISWIESQSIETQASHAARGLGLLLGEAGQPKAVSGNACVRLCGFVEKCAKSQSQHLREWAFSRDVIEKLFTFYIEWNESDQHRSMKLVLDAIVQLGKWNPDRDAALSIQEGLLKNLVSFVIGTSTKPVAKSAIKTIDHFFTKRVFNLDDIRLTYIKCRTQANSCDEIEVWGTFFAEIFQWMKIHFVCPTAGKFIVLLYRGLRSRGPDRPELKVELLNQWLLNFLAEDPSLLERVKNYVFVPLFKADRPEALKFLRLMNSHEITTSMQGLEMDISSLLQLAALETGKRVGLVEEPALSVESKANDEAPSLVLHDKILTSVLSHPAHEVRSLAFSLLITCPSTTRPYSSTALDLLRKKLGTYFADPDAKFRVDVMSKARDMFKRVRGAICVLKRSIPRARAKARQRQVVTDQGTGAEAANTQPIMYHTNLISLPESQLVHCLDYHEQFLRWYIGFLSKELTPTASYQRHVGSLKALSSILRMEGETSKSWETADDQELFFDLFDETWVRALFDLVMDPFDDVRDMAAAALRSLLSDKRYRRFTLKTSELDGLPIEELESFLSRSNELARRTARADHSDGAARASQLLYKLSDEGDKRLAVLERLVNELHEKLSVAGKDLGRAVLEASVHGDFAAMRYIWQVVSETKFGKQELEETQKLQDILVGCCEKIWYAVRDILCDDSPEGHLPQELEDVDGLNTKDVLSYSFRAIQESSNLMRTLILTIRNRSKPKLISPSPVSFERIGNLSFVQLSTLRHRGAFATVSMTFATCCQQAKHLEPNDTIASESLLGSWYKGTMDAIFAQASTTRRSAGIPSLMTGILSANSSDPSFEQVMERLIDIASTEARVRETDGSNLPQVHAYNCLKDIFKNSILTSMGNKSEKYLTRCLELAANGLKSEVWAIRNCGLILIRSLIDSLFGTRDSKAMIESGWDGKANRIPYHRYPALPNVLVNLLKSGHQMMVPTAIDTAGAESVFPALDIVRRAGPPDILRKELQVHIAKYLASPVWHVRDMAARTLCSCLLHDQWLAVIKELLQNAVQDRTRNSQNHVHGILMALKFVFDRLHEVALYRLLSNVSDLVNMIKEFKIDERYAQCPDILTAYLDLVNQISEFGLLHSTSIEQIQVSVPPVCGSALLKIQVATYEIHAAYRSEAPVERLRKVLLGADIGSDTMVATLELLPRLWKKSWTSDAILSELCGFYVDICLQTSLNGPLAVALQNLSCILDHLLAKKKFELVHHVQLHSLWATLPLCAMNPSLSNAILRVSGAIFAVLNHWKQLSPNGLRGWGVMIGDAGLDDKSFDTRFAAAESLLSFFAVSGQSCTSEEYLPAMLALYDALNDDDDEVRDVGSAAVKNIVGQVLVPIDAANRLLEWLTATFGGSSTFKGIVATRITGSKSIGTPWEPANVLINAALMIDDSLFVVEEQNLFIDEIREANRWISAHEDLEWDASDALLQRLDGWLQQGLERLQLLMEHEDGPLGWASNPQAFAICSLVILASVSMASKNRASSELRQSVENLRERLHANKAKHLSGLLTEPLKGFRIH